MIMLLPSIVSICLLQYLERFNIRYKKISDAELSQNVVRDVVWSILSVIALVLMLCIFVVIFVAPFVTDWPNKISFSMEHFVSVFTDSVC